MSSEPPNLFGTTVPPAPPPTGHDVPPAAVDPDATTPPAPPAADREERIGDYVLVREIARGGMGVVYLARHVRLGRLVALKMILGGQAGSADLLRFRKEAEAAAHLDHPGIVPVYDFGEHEGKPYFTMAFIEGRSLAVRLRQGPLENTVAAGIVRAAAEAVQYAHERGVIHRDLKPGNVLLDKDGTVKVTDFGLARRIRPDETEPEPAGEPEAPPPSATTEELHRLTMTGAILGTPSYMAPEQAADAKRVGPPADVWALGAMLYALLTGRPPFLGTSLLETLAQVVDAQPVSPRSLNPAIDADLETICLKALRKEPADRYASAADLADDLRRWQAGLPLRARPPGRLERLLRASDANPAVLPFAAGLVTMHLAGMQEGLFVGSAFGAMHLPARGPTPRAMLLLGGIGVLLAAAGALLPGTDAPTALDFVVGCLGAAALGMLSAVGESSLRERARWYRRCLIFLVVGAVVVGLPVAYLHGRLSASAASDSLVLLGFLRTVLGWLPWLLFGVVAIVCLVVAGWLIRQADAILERFGLPERGVGCLAALVLLGLIAILVLLGIVAYDQAQKASQLQFSSLAQADVPLSQIIDPAAAGLRSAFAGLAAVLLGVSAGMLVGWLRRRAVARRPDQPRATTAGFVFGAAVTVVLTLVALALAFPPPDELDPPSRFVQYGSGPVAEAAGATARVLIHTGSDATAWPIVALVKLLLLGIPLAVGGLAGSGLVSLRAGEVSVMNTPDPPSPTVAHGPADPAPAMPPTPRFGEYELLGEVERGPGGTIYQARQVSLDRPVALTLIAPQCLPTPEAVATFRHEAEAAARLDHPSIARVFEVGEHEGWHFVAAAWIEGESLARRLEAGPLRDREAARLVRQLAETLHHAHSKDVIDGALSPAKVLLGRDGTVRLRDCGLRSLGPDPTAPDTVLSESQQAPTGSVPSDAAGYLPPERVAAKDRPVRKRADVYGLGAILYAALTGRPPFQAANREETLRQVRDGSVLPPSRLNPRVNRDLEAVCLRCLQRWPRERYPSAAKLLSDLLAWLARRPVQARPGGRLRRTLLWCGRNRQVLILALVALVFGGGPEAWHWWRTRAQGKAMWATVTQPDAAAEQYQRALRYYERRRIHSPHDPDVRLGLGIALYRLGRYTEAEPLLAPPARSVYPMPDAGSTRDLYWRLALLQMGRSREALQSWNLLPPPGGARTGREEVLDNPEAQELFLSPANLLRWLADPELPVREAAVQLFAELRSRRGAAGVAPALPRLAEQLADPAAWEPAWRVLDALPIDRLWPQSREGSRAIEALTRLPPGPGENRKVAIRLLGKIGPLASVAIPVLVEELVASGGFQTRDLAEAALARIDSDWPRSTQARKAVPALILRLTEEGEIRTVARTLLDRIDKGWPRQPEARQCIPTLMLRLAGPQQDAGRGTRDVLGAIDPDWERSAEARQTVKALVERLRAADTDNERISGLLGSLGPTAAEALPALIWASAGLGRTGLPNAAAAAALPKIDPNWQRSEAAKQAAVALTSRLANPEEPYFTSVIDTLLGLGPAARQAIPTLQKLLADGGVRVRPRALAALAVIDPEWYRGEAGLRAYRDLLQILGNRVIQVRFEALECCRRLPRHRDAGPAVTALVPLVADPALRTSAEEILGRLDRDWAKSEAGRRAIPNLVRQLADRSALLRAGAARTLAKFGPAAAPAVPALLDLLTDGEEANNRRIAQDALMALTNIDPNWHRSEVARQRIPDLVMSLADPQVCAVADEALAQIDPNWPVLEAAREGICGLIADLEDPHSARCLGAAQTLGRFGPAAAPAVDALVDVVRAGPGTHVQAAAATLRGIGPAAAPAVPALMSRLDDNDLATLRAVLQTLGDLGPKAGEAIPALVPHLTDAPGWTVEHEAIRSAAAEALGRIDKDWPRTARAKQAIPALLERLADPVAKVREPAGELLDRLDPDWRHSAAAVRAVPRLAKRLAEDDPLTREGAAAALGRIGRPADAAVPALLGRLDDLGTDTAPVGKTVTDALNRIRPGWRDSREVWEIVPALEQRSASTIPAQRLASVAALDSLGAAARPAMAALIARLGDPDSAVHRAAAEAVGHLGPRAEDVPALLARLGDCQAQASSTEDPGQAVRELLKRADKAWRRSEAVVRIVPTYAKQLTDLNSGTRRAAAETLSQFGPASAAAAADLAKLLGDINPPVRLAAAKALGSIGPEAAPALANLVAALADPEPEVGQEARLALDQIDRQWPKSKAADTVRRTLWANPTPRGGREADGLRRALQTLEAARSALPGD